LSLRASNTRAAGVPQHTKANVSLQADAQKITTAMARLWEEKSTHTQQNHQDSQYAGKTSPF